MGVRDLDIRAPYESIGHDRFLGQPFLQNRPLCGGEYVVLPSHKAVIDAFDDSNAVEFPDEFYSLRGGCEMVTGLLEVVADDGIGGEEDFLALARKDALGFRSCPVERLRDVDYLGLIYLLNDSQRAEFVQKIETKTLNIVLRDGKALTGMEAVELKANEYDESAGYSMRKVRVPVITLENLSGILAADLSLSHSPLGLSTYLNSNDAFYEIVRELAFEHDASLIVTDVLILRMMKAGFDFDPEKVASMCTKMNAPEAFSLVTHWTYRVVSPSSTRFLGLAERIGDEMVTRYVTAGITDSCQIAELFDAGVSPDFASRTLVEAKSAAMMLS